MFYSFRSHFISLNFSNNFSLTPFTRRFVSFLCSLHLIWTQWKVDAMVEKSIYGNLGRLNFLRLFLPANLNRRSVSLANFWSTATTEVLLTVSITFRKVKRTIDNCIFEMHRNAEKSVWKMLRLIHSWLIKNSIYPISFDPSTHRHFSLTDIADFIILNVLSISIVLNFKIVLP